MRQRLFALSLLLTLVSAVSTYGRVISYSPYTDQSAFPAHQHRMNRHFVLVEGGGGGFSPLPILPPPGSGPSTVVLYDFLGIEEPRVIYPQHGQVSVHGVAVRENASGVPSILILSTEQGTTRFRLSTDAGATWKTLSIQLPGPIQFMPTGIDVGGPHAAARGSQLRIGNERWPFVVTNRTAVYAIAPDGSTRTLFDQPSGTAGVMLLGSDATGTRFLLAATGSIHILDVDAGTAQPIATQNAMQNIDGWITPAGGAYVTEITSTIRLSYIANGVRTLILEEPANALNLFAVPTHDYSGAWVIQRGAGKPTVLYRHDPMAGLVKQWEDITAPEVEALHAAASGTKLLVQVHRPRPQADQRIFQDPALAVWRIGDPAPRVYDELYMDEQFNKGFVHLDVDKIEEGEPFVFDSGVRFVGGSPIISPAPPSSGGGDVVQEWGVVRASLKQRLVLPAVGRGRGAFDSNWVTDVILYNPMDETQSVDIRFVPSGAPSSAAQNQTRTLELAPQEIRLVEDVLLSLFLTEAATGALFIEPEHGITMTSRTYSTSDNGTYGYSMNAMDVYAAAASARFPLTFAGAFLGATYRTNIVMTDAGEHGSTVNLRATGPLGLMGLSNIMYDVPSRGQQQYNFISSTLGVYPWETGGLVFRPTRGSAIGSVFTTDNRTNDSTYFPPDLPAPVVRTIPAIGHVDGANNSHFRSDIYLFNPTSQLSTVTLQIRMWDSPDTATLNFTLLPAEARIIPDALVTLFQRRGIARLRYSSQFGTQNGVRVTSRTYSIREDGGTYGFLMPPLNNFQSGGPGDTLEILGAVADENFRTNIGLVELTGLGSGNPINVRIEIVDAEGDVADSFTANVPFAGGMQLNDVFRARSLNISGPVLIRVSPLGGLVGAYATHIDNRTNDASYLAANLGAKQ